MHIPADDYTLLDYERAGHPVKPHAQLRGAKRALFDGETIWVSHAMAELWHDRRDRAFRRKFLKAVEVVVVESIRSGWREAL